MQGAKPEIAPIELTKETVLEALFKERTETQPKPRVRSKRHRSSHTTEASDETRARTKEQTEVEQDRRASLVDEEIRLRREKNIVIGASSSVAESKARNNIDGVEIEVYDTTDGSILRDVRITRCCLIADPMGSGKSDPPIFLEMFGAMRHMFASPTTLCL